jgi:hypothetical protein
MLARVPELYSSDIFNNICEQKCNQLAEFDSISAQEKCTKEAIKKKQHSFEFVYRFQEDAIF